MVWKGVTFLSYSKKICSYSLGLSLALLPCSHVAADMLAMPDSGSISATIYDDRSWKPKEDKDEVDVHINLGEIQNGNGNVKIKVNEIQLRGNTIYSAEKLLAQAGDSIQPEMSFNDLLAVAQCITDFYRSKGYMTTIAYIPTQDIVHGTVIIDIMEGAYDVVSFDNASSLLTGRAAGIAHSVKKDRIIKRQELDRALLILNDIPGIKAHAFLSPGQEPGEAKTVLKLTDIEKSGGFIYADNFGNHFTGRNRLGAIYHWNNISHVGDQLQAGYLRSIQGDDLQNFSLKYELPVLNFGTFGGLEYYRTDYELGEKYRFMNAYGMADTIRLFTKTPWKRSIDNNLYFIFNLGYSKLTDRIRLWGTDNRKHGYFMRFGLDGDYRNRTYAASYKLMHTVGHMVLDSADALKNDLFHIDGVYQKTVFDGFYIHKLSDNLNLHCSLSGQKSWTNLDSSEKFYIGGYNGVRAFPQGEASGDNGILGNIEFRYTLGNSNWQLAAFYDAGWVKYMHDNHDGPNSRYINGAGVGIIWQKTGGVYARLDYALPLGNKYSESYGHDMHGIWWFQVVAKI